MGTRVAILPINVIVPSESEKAEGSLSNALGRFLRLPHPRTGIPSLFLSAISPRNNGSGDAESRILEVQCVSPDAQRSWFIDNHVESNGELLLFTPIDPAFLLAPLLRVVFPVVPGGLEHRFRTTDDILEEAANSLFPTRSSADSSNSTLNEHAQVMAADIIYLSSIACVRSVFDRICETKDITEDVVLYKYSESKLLDLLRTKAGKLAEPETFLSFPSLSRPLARLGLHREQDFSAITNGIANGEQFEFLVLSARLKAACEVMSQYLSPDLSQILFSSYDFRALDKYLADLAAEEEFPLERVADNKKRTVASAVTADLKGAKGANGPSSRGVKGLKRADTTGMSKLSSFFKKKEEIVNVEA